MTKRILTMNVSLGKVWEDYVSERVSSGQFNNASEVVRDALRLQQERQMKLEVLRREVFKGMKSVEQGRTSRASAADIVAKAKAKMK
jgi:antitoxin ParD1/3/4